MPQSPDTLFQPEPFTLETLFATKIDSLSQLYQNKDISFLEFLKEHLSPSLKPDTELFKPIIEYIAKECAEKLSIDCPAQPFSDANFWCLLAQAQTHDNTSILDILSELPAHLAAPLLQTQLNKLPPDVNSEYCLRLLRYQNGQLILMLCGDTLNTTQNEITAIMSHYNHLTIEEQKSLCHFTVETYYYYFCNNLDPELLDIVLEQKAQSGHPIASTSKGNSDDLPMLDVLAYNVLPKTLKAFINQELTKESGKFRLRQLLSHKDGTVSDGNNDNPHIIIYLATPFNVSPEKIDCCFQLIELTQQVDWCILNLFNHPNIGAIIEDSGPDSREQIRYNIMIRGYDILRLKHDQLLPISMRLFDLFLTEILKHPTETYYPLALTKQGYIDNFSQNEGTSYTTDKCNSNTPDVVDMTDTLKLLRALLTTNFKKVYTNNRHMNQVNETCPTETDLLEKYIAPRRIINACLQQPNRSLRKKMLFLLWAQATKPLRLGINEKPDFTFFEELLDEERLDITEQHKSKRPRT